MNTERHNSAFMLRFLTYFIGILLIGVAFNLYVDHCAGGFVLFSNDGPIGGMMADQAEMSARNNPAWFTVALWLMLSFIGACFLVDDEKENPKPK